MPKKTVIFLMFLSAPLAGGGCATQQVSLDSGSPPGGEADEIWRETNYAPRQVEDLPSLPTESPLFFVSPEPLQAEPYRLRSFNGTAKPEAGAESVVMEGYRVQLFSGSEPTYARRLEQDLRELYDLPVYLVYEAPRYKVRLGDFTDRDEAVVLCNALKDQGFRDAWVVRSVVNVVR